MAADKPTVTLADLTRLQEQESRPTPLAPDEVVDYATAILLVVRGLSRADKLKAIRRAIRMLGSR